MSFLADLGRAVKAGRRAVHRLQATVQAVEQGAADVQSLAQNAAAAAEQLRAAGAQVRQTLAGADDALLRAVPQVKATVRTPSRGDERADEVVEAEVIDFGGPRSVRRP